MAHIFIFFLLLENKFTDDFDLCDINWLHSCLFLINNVLKLSSHWSTYFVTEQLGKFQNCCTYFVEASIWISNKYAYILLIPKLNTHLNTEYCIHPKIYNEGQVMSDMIVRTSYVTFGSTTIRPLKIRLHTSLVSSLLWMMYNQVWYSISQFQGERKNWRR